MKHSQNNEPIFGVTKESSPILYRIFGWLSGIGLIILLIVLLVWGLAMAVAKVL
jgi:hypothetical protein